MACLNQELNALRRIGNHAFRGGNMPHSFGCGGDPYLQDGRVWLFEIHLTDGRRLEAVIDGYCATIPDPNTPRFNLNAWEAGKIVMSASANRSGYQQFQHFSRVILKGLQRRTS